LNFTSSTSNRIELVFSTVVHKFNKCPSRRVLSALYFHRYLSRPDRFDWRIPTDFECRVHAVHNVRYLVIGQNIIQIHPGHCYTVDRVYQPSVFRIPITTLIFYANVVHTNGSRCITVYLRIILNYKLIYNIICRNKHLDRYYT